MKTPEKIFFTDSCFLCLLTVALTTLWVADVSAATNEGNPDEGPVYHGAGGLAHIGDRVFLNSTNNAMMRINFTWKSLIPILMIVKQCTHLWGLRNTLTLPVSSLDQPHEDGDLRSMTPVKAHGLLGVILSAPASTSCHLSQPFCNLSPISNRIPPQPHFWIVLRVANNSDCLVFITPFLGFPILCAGHVCLSCKCDIDFKCMYLGRLVPRWE